MMLAFFLVINSQSIDTFAGMVGSLEDRLWHAVCVCVCVHACVPIFAGVYVHVYACTERPETCIKCHFSGTQHLIFWVRCFNWGFAGLLGWQASRPRDPVTSASLSRYSKSDLLKCTTLVAFYVGTGDQTYILMVAWQALYQLSYYIHSRMYVCMYTNHISDSSPV